MAQSSYSYLSSWIYRYRYAFFFAVIFIGYAINLGTDIMEIDAAQYAAISSEMAKSGNYLQVYLRGQDYLDKPPLLFWLSSTGIAILGNTSLAYKILPVIFLIIALWATYRFARLWYDQRTATIASVILGTTQAFHLMSNDVRTDGLLTSFVMLSIWQLSEYLHNKSMRALLMAGICIGGAMLAKGPVGLFIPAVAVGGHFLLSGQWKKIFNPWWLLLLVPCLLLLAPMCYGLYTQFDMHPEKEVYGLKGPSGIGFYFWTQSFGRITGDSQWSNNTPWYFFIQTILWDLQPWVLLFIPALWNNIKMLLNKGGAVLQKPEWISLCGFILPFIALSFSGYKLPHYIFPLFPFASVMIATYLVQYAKSLPRWFEYAQLGIIHFLLIASLLIMFWAFPLANPWLPLLWVILYAGMWWWRSNALDDTDRWLMPSLAGTLLFQLIVSLHFYPHLLQYQSTSQAGRYIEEHNPPGVYWHDKFGYALDYYSGRTIPNAYGPPVDTLRPGTWIFVSESALPTMPPNKVIKEFDDFPVTRLSTSFLDPKKRSQKVKNMYLIELVKRE
jgi:4-amino-4-deoxy-L-arabinose transferase-like glycosyltransferase